MRKHLEDYRDIVGDAAIDEIYDAASYLSGKHVVNINSTYQGGGVAEILNTLVLLMNDVGIGAGWRILHGNRDFFVVTKKFHNALQGGKLNLTAKKKEIYESVNENFSIFTHLDHDCIIVHDPQPLPLIQFYEKKQPWVWRVHIDLSKQERDGENLLNYLKSFILKYDTMVVSMESYKKELPIEQKVIQPSIDPFSFKNEELKQDVIDKYLRKFGIGTDKPIITQVSRFDRFKDPDGVIKVYEKVKKKVDCRLVLAGNMAVDDPESEKIYANLLSKYGGNEDITLISSTHDILVNALQRESSVVIQKSFREGFALTVSEALWKRTPVVGSNVGGIKAQIIDGENGYLVDPKDYDGCASRVVKLLEDEKLASAMGARGREIVRERFLTPRHLYDYIKLLNILINKREIT